jgi:hypothetical protein
MSKNAAVSGKGAPATTVWSLMMHGVGAAQAAQAVLSEL